MAGMAILNVVGLVVGIGMMTPGLIPKQDEHKTIVRVGAGLSSNSIDNTKGNTPGIRLWDIMGRTIGGTLGSGSVIQDGSFTDIEVPFDDGVGKEPFEYMSVVNGGNDALCIAYLAITQPDGTKKVWYGDIAKRCGADWYHSMLKTGDDDYQPACVWIDRDYSNGLRFQGFGLHINDFAASKERAEQYRNDNDLMCKADPRFKMYEKMDSSTLIQTFQPPLEYVETTLIDKDPAAVMDQTRWVMASSVPRSHILADASASKFKHIPRDAATGQLGSAESSVNDSDTSPRRLVISSSTHHSAQLLCDSPSSNGPDFVSLDENLFCDMDQKQIYPLCDSPRMRGCFDRDAQMIRSMTIRGRDVTMGNSTKAAANPYSKVDIWD